jgi:transcription elongation factor GreA
VLVSCATLGQDRPSVERRKDASMVSHRSVQLTPAGKARLEDELQTLVATKLPELQARIQEANEHGDISDNSEYEELKEDLILTEARIRELDGLLQRAELIQREEGMETIGLGSTVTLETDDGETETWVLVVPEEANTLDGSISTDSPVGRALVGRRVGESAVVQTPGGEIVYTVVKVA